MDCSRATAEPSIRPRFRAADARSSYPLGMPEGDTLARIRDVLRPLLVGKEIRAARGRPGGARLERVIGRTVVSVETRGKHLLIEFDNGLTLHTHLGLHGSWHRYRRGEM